MSVRQPERRFIVTGVKGENTTNNGNHFTPAALTVRKARSRSGARQARTWSMSGPSTNGLSLAFHSRLNANGYHPQTRFGRKNTDTATGHTNAMRSESSANRRNVTTSGGRRVFRNRQNAGKKRVDCVSTLMPSLNAPRKALRCSEQRVNLGFGRDSTCLISRAR